MMAQEFAYPNLLRSSRRRFVFHSAGIVIGSVAMRDGVVGDYQRVTLDADAKDWAYVYVPGINANAAGNVPEGTELVLSCFVRVDGEPKEARPTLLTLRCGDGTKEILNGKAFAHESVGGGWTLYVTRAERNAVAYGEQVFYVKLPLYKAGTTIDVAQPAIFVGTKSYAWAPAEGESLAGGGCSHER